MTAYLVILTILTTTVAAQELPRCYLIPGVQFKAVPTDINNYGNWLVPGEGGLPVNQSIFFEDDFNGVIHSVTGLEVISLLGESLTANDAQQAYDPTWNSTQLDGTELLVNGTPANLIYAGLRLDGNMEELASGQIVAVLPYLLAPGSTLQVRQTAAGGQCLGNVVTPQVVQQAGALYKGPSGVNLYDATSGRPVNTVSGSQWLTLYGWGFGALTIPVRAGTPAPLEVNSLAGGTITFTMAGQSTLVGYAGAMPGGVGLYQFNVQVPTVGPGTYQVAMAFNGQIVEKFSLTVQ